MAHSFGTRLSAGYLIPCQTVSTGQLQLRIQSTGYAKGPATRSTFLVRFPGKNEDQNDGRWAFSESADRYADQARHAEPAESSYPISRLAKNHSAPENRVWLLWFLDQVDRRLPHDKIPTSPIGFAPPALRFAGPARVLQHIEFQRTSLDNWLFRWGGDLGHTEGNSLGQRILRHHLPGVGCAAAPPVSGWSERCRLVDSFPESGASSLVPLGDCWQTSQGSLTFAGSAHRLPLIHTGSDIDELRPKFPIRSDHRHRRSKIPDLSSAVARLA